MKQIFTTLFALFVFSLASAQVPKSMSYQAVARDAGGNCLSDTTLSLEISILADSPGGGVVYKERFEGNVQTNDAGHFQVEIGKGSPQVGGIYTDFTQINWNNQVFFMNVKYGLGSSAPITDIGTAQLLTVPYALVAGNGKSYSNINQDEWIEFKGTNGNANVTIGGLGTPGAFNRGVVSVNGEDGSAKANIVAESDGAGKIFLQGANGNLNFIFGTGATPNEGALTARDENGVDKAFFGSDNGRGVIGLKGANGSANVVIGTNADPNKGAMTIRDETGATKVVLQISSQGSGYGEVATFGPAGTVNAVLGANGNCPEFGQILVVDAAGAGQAGIIVNCNGVGEVWGDVKSFVMDHPTKSDKQIVYACIEGPEAAAYERGTVMLVNGEAEVLFSETFEIVANPTTMTVMTTPWSAESKGLAVVERTEKGFRIKELGGGTGNYKVDWEAKAVRKGWEDFEVIRDKDKVEPVGIFETAEKED